MKLLLPAVPDLSEATLFFHMLKKYPDYRIICLDCLTYAGNLSTLAPVMDNPNLSVL